MFVVVLTVSKSSVMNMLWSTAGAMQHWFNIMGTTGDFKFPLTQLCGQWMTGPLPE